MKILSPPRSGPPRRQTKRRRFALLASPTVSAVVVAASGPPVLVATLATAVATGLAVDPLAFAGAAVLTMGLGSAHLGRRARAHRAVRRGGG